MADERINELTTTTSVAGDDYLPVDGTVNGTRKILPANLPVSTATAVSIAAAIVTAENAAAVASAAAILAERTAVATLTNKTLTSPVVNTPTGIVKGDVGLGNVDNTSDANKPVSTATQTALDLKANASDVTTSLATKADLLADYNTQTGDYTLVLGDKLKTIQMNKASAQALTIPTHASVAFPVGLVIAGRTIGAGQTTIAGAGGVTLTSRGGATKSGGQWAAWSLEQISQDNWVLDGDVST